MSHRQLGVHAVDLVPIGVHLVLQRNHPQTRANASKQRPRCEGLRHKIIDSRLEEPHQRACALTGCEIIREGWHQVGYLWFFMGGCIYPHGRAHCFVVWGFYKQSATRRVGGGPERSGGGPPTVGWGGGAHALPPGR